MKYITLLFLASLSLVAKDLGVIDVTDSSYTNKEQESFSDVFRDVEYFENVEHVNSMPAQKRLSSDEAMFIPGVQGDPIKAVKSLSGITSISDASGELFIYGSKPEESLTTINHLPIGYLFHMGGLHSVIAPDAIDQIDAYMAGFDVTYGDAMGGVINVTPKYPKNEFSGYGHLGLYDASAGVNVAVNKDVSFYLGARRSYFDLLLPKTGDLDDDGEVTYTEFPNYYDLTFIGTFKYDDTNFFSLEIISAADSLDIYSETNKVKDPDATGQVKSDFGFTTIGLRHQGYFENYETNTLIYNKKENYKTKLFDDFYIDLDQDEYGLFHQSSYFLNDHTLIAGIELQKYYLPTDFNIPKTQSDENPDTDITSSPVVSGKLDISLLNSSVFLQDIYAINDHFKLKYGVRFSSSSYENLGSYTDPRISLLYKVDEKNNISFAIGKYTQMPVGYKLTKELGNKNAEFERAHHYLVHYDNSFIDGVDFNIDLFYKKYDNLLIDDNASNFLNDGEGHSYGFDTNIKYKSDKYFAFLAYTYLRSQREINTKYGDELFRFYGEVPHTLQIIGGMKLWGDFALSTRLNYHSGKPYTKIIGTYDDNGRIRPIYENPYNSRLPDYFSLNVKIAQELKFANNNSLEWSFEIMNITNHDNIASIEYDDNYNSEGKNKGLPLLPWFDLTYRF